MHFIAEGGEGSSSKTHDVGGSGEVERAVGKDEGTAVEKAKGKKNAGRQVWRAGGGRVSVKR